MVQADGRKNVRLSVRQKKKKKFYGQTDGRKSVRLSVRQKKKKIPDRQTDIFSSVCLSVKKNVSCYVTVLLRHGDSAVTRQWRNKVVT